ncbi:J domain-containing protein [Rufibacter latericius]|uniref:J domain-containing protein n=1 Tax=Rufibacter latericius TaxID=2487040 RepID=A0A3M9N3L0_9BACT|nr:J domain-containing protein [Rufibacter latericius]RNI31598.1 hypothetical protein EFB08_03525 [Rufibacter latericius]
MLTESYRVLGVPFGADMPQIRHAYRQLVLQYHPDRNHHPDAPAMFLRIQSAYEYLQRFQELATAPAKTQAAATSPPQPQSDWEKYQYTYDPPADPKEYLAWAAVARERARRQKEKDHAEYVRRTLEMKQKWWFPLAYYSSYLVLVLGAMAGLVFLLIPLLFLVTGQFRSMFLGVMTVPMGIMIMRLMQVLRQDIRKHFGEDLPELSK